MFRLPLTRTLHTVPRLSKGPLASVGPLSPAGFTVAWTQYQQHLTNELNVLTAGTADESRSPLAITLMSQGDSKRQRVHDVASQAFNNHFFFQQFAVEGSKAVGLGQPSRTLLDRINTSFGSLDALKQEVLDASDGIVGQGWVYVVEEADKSLKVLALNNSGSPFTNVKLDLDLNGAITEEDYLKVLERKEVGENYTLPLIAFNLWDFAYLEDFGITGRRAFVEKTWAALDWSVINKRVFAF